MENENYLKDISEIKSIMERSSKFISLSGLSGVLAGLYAFVAAYLAAGILRREMLTLSYQQQADLGSRMSELMGLGLITAILAIATAIYFSARRARKLKIKAWDQTSRRLVLNLFIPLVAGGLFILILISKGFIGMIAPLTLIFYGLALINASKYTLSDIRQLGVAEVILGLLAALYIGYGLYFWAAGFGLLHIIYGAVMYIKYERSSK